MSHTGYLWVVALVFTLVAILHLSRIVTGFDVYFGGVEIPMWASWIGLIVTLILAFLGYKYAGEGSDMSGM